MDIEKKIVNNIKNLNLEMTSFNYVYKCVRDLMVGYSIIDFPGKPVCVYRARINIGGNKIRNIGELWYPPANLIHDIGRANKKGESVFYCSNNVETAVLEKCPEKNDVVTVMECRIKNLKLVNKLNVVGLGFSDKAVFKSKDKTIKWNEYKIKKITAYYANRLTQHEIGEQLKKNSLIDKFLNEEFRKTKIRGSFDYKITASIARMFINNPKGTTIHAICYPSISKNYKDYNWVFTPEAADAFFVPTRFLEIKIARKEGNRYETVKLQHSGAIDKNRNIIWKSYRNKQ